MKRLLLIVPAFLIGCAPIPPKPQDPCIVAPIYKPYKIDIPERPKLESDQITDTTTDGVVVRTIESDMSKLIEYALKLENILKSIPSNIEIKQ